MIIDIILIALIVLGAFAGYKKGLTKILMGMIGFLLALILAFMFKGSVANFIIDYTNVEDTMYNTISEGLNSSLNQDPNSKEEETFYTMIIDKIGIGESVEKLANNIVKFILEVASFILIFFIVMIIVWIIQTMLDLVFDLPILSSINNIGGLAAGGIMTILKIWILLSILTMLSPMMPIIQETINNTTVTKILYNSNLIVKMLSSGFKI